MSAAIEPDLSGIEHDETRFIVFAKAQQKAKAAS
jgi:hypothetical protein